MKDKTEELENKIGFNFQNKELIRQALIHRSYLNENPDINLDHNERLEFLGDAVLELVVTEHLYLNYPNPEGELTSWRASLVNTITMSQVADSLCLGDYLYLSKGEAKDFGKARQAILANTLEAVIGALYLDQGYKIVSIFINKNIITRLEEILDKGLWRDSKSYFQEMAQDRVGETPIYKVLLESGPDHAKKFKVGVFIKNQKIAEGEGDSKQEAEQSAAQAGLEIKGWK